MLALVDRARADEHRPAELRAVRAMSSMIACHLSSAVPKTSVGSFSRIGGRFVGTGIDAALVNLAQLAGAGAGGARHAGQPVVAEEKILHGDPRGLRSWRT